MNRNISLAQDRKLKRAARGTSGWSDIIWAQRQYHNERVYWHIEFFAKITIAICGGVSYLAITSDVKNLILVSRIILLACVLEVFVGIYCSYFIYLHSLTKWLKTENKVDAKRRVFKSSDFKQALMILVVSILISIALIFLFLEPKWLNTLYHVILKYL